MKHPIIIPNLGLVEAVTVTGREIKTHHCPPEQACGFLVKPRATWAYVGTAAPGCPAERSSAAPSADLSPQLRRSKRLRG